MESLRVKKQPLPVTLYLVDGTVESGTVFMPATSSRHTGSSTIAELMDESDHLLRFKLQGDRFQLVGKAGIAAIKSVAAPHAEGFYEKTAAYVKVMGGHTFDGSLLVEAGVGGRISDGIVESWLQMETGGGVAWIQRDHILVLETR